jgi:hypothetical protein
MNHLIFPYKEIKNSGGDAFRTPSKALFAGCKAGPDRGLAYFRHEGAGFL